ncbi:ATP-binding protein [Billgrantia sp. LNSP4103-1]|uniref:sensor histidine kinase n=1 Tax=Billgrantia sp. LNSP4103-1 TaxID=3410266 RepID=UPI00403FBE10
MRHLSAIALHRLASLLAFLLLIALALQAGRVQQALLDANDAVDDGLELISAIQDLQLSLLDVETGERGFVITGRSDYLIPYRQARERLDAERNYLLEQLTSKGSLPSSEITALEELIARRVQIAESNIAVRESDGLEAAALRLLAAGGRQTMVRIRDILDPLKNTQRELLAMQSKRASQQAARARQVGVAGILLVAALFIAAYGALNRVLTIRRRLLNDAEQREARLQALLHSVPDELFLIDDSQRCHRLVGKSPVAEPFAHELSRRLSERGAEGLQSFIWHDPNGTEFEVRMLPTRDDEYLVIARDITERREIERMKAEFIATVSHELRTPLTAVRGALGMLRQGYGGNLPEDAQPLVGVADKNCERLVHLIDDILDIEKLEAGQLEFRLQRVELVPLVKQALGDNAPYAESFGIGLCLVSASDTGDVELDPQRFAQVMANLISNACKHSPSGASVEVSVAPLLRDERQWWEVAVRDRGEGIPLEFQPRVFERFAQADSSDRRRIGGTGLGLSITRSLVLAMKGEIDFTSVPGEGSEFRVRFPALTGAGSHARQEEGHP